MVVKIGTKKRLLQTKFIIIQIAVLSSLQRYYIDRSLPFVLQYTKILQSFILYTIYNVMLYTFPNYREVDDIHSILTHSTGSWSSSSSSRSSRSMRYSTDCPVLVPGAGGVVLPIGTKTTSSHPTLTTTIPTLHGSECSVKLLTLLYISRITNTAQ